MWLSSLPSLALFLYQHSPLPHRLLFSSAVPSLPSFFNMQVIDRYLLCDVLSPSGATIGSSFQIYNFFCYNVEHQFILLQMFDSLIS